MTLVIWIEVPAGQGTQMLHCEATSGYCDDTKIQGQLMLGGHEGS